MQTRFSKENKRNPSGFLAFGGGPRMCLGMKFAYIEISMVLTKVLKRFEIQRGENFKENLNYCDAFITLITDPIMIKLAERKY